MPPATGLQALTQGGIISPFTRARRLFENIAPGHAKPIELTVGDPREAMPAFVTAKLAEGTELGSYPKIRGSDQLRNAIAAWIGRRYGLAGAIDAMREICPSAARAKACTSRRALPAVGRKQFDGHPVMLVTNPYYQAYVAARTVPAASRFSTHGGHRPPARPRRAGAPARHPAPHRRVLPGSPANPQGAVLLTPDYIRRALALARRYDFILFFDERYSEIYMVAPPDRRSRGRRRHPERFKNLLVFEFVVRSARTCPGCARLRRRRRRLLETLAETAI